MAPASQTVEYISNKMIKPSNLPKPNDRERLINLTPWELELLSYNYIQCGFIYPKVKLDNELITHMENTTCDTMYHFYPLCGRLCTQKNEDGISIFLDVNAGDGFRFAHAIANHVYITDVFESQVSSPLNRSLFLLNDAVNHDGHFLPLFAMQVTELADAVVIGTSINHVMMDGATSLHLSYTWSKLFLGEVEHYTLLPRPPIHDRTFMEKLTKTPIKLPFKLGEEFIHRQAPPANLRQKTFKISGRSISFLKSKANAENSKQQTQIADGEISSFQALSSFLWRMVTRARNLPPDQVTTCRIATNNRPKLNPPLPQEYFGCASVYVCTDETTVENLMSDDIRYGAQLLQRAVKAQTDKAIKDGYREWSEAPKFYNLGEYNKNGLSIDSSTRFFMYGVEARGSLRAFRSGPGNQHDGKIWVYQGQQGGGVDVEVILEADTMDSLEKDDEFLSMADIVSKI